MEIADVANSQNKKLVIGLKMNQTVHKQLGLD